MMEDHLDTLVVACGDTPTPSGGSHPSRALAWAAHLGIVGMAAVNASLHRRLVNRGANRLAASLATVAAAIGWVAIDQAERRRPFDPAWQKNQGDFGADVASTLSSVAPATAGNLAGKSLGRLVIRRSGLRPMLGRAPGVVAVPAALVA